VRPLVLASASPRRAELLKAAGIPFVVRPADVSEVRAVGEDPESYVLRLAWEKAMGVVAEAGEWVLAADTTVVADGHVLEKPVDPEDAARALRLLSGRWHEVLTGVCLRTAEAILSHCERTRVRFVELDAEQIAEYVCSGEPMDKAGAYGVQGLASKFVDRIEGCYFNVVGLPVAAVWRLLRSCRGQ